MKVIDALAEQFPDSSKNTMRQWVSQGRIMVDGAIAKSCDAPVTPGQKLTLGPKVQPLQQGIQIIYEDRDFIVVDKPPGLLSVGTEKQKEFTLHSFLKRRFHRPRITPIHRLDRETSGLIIFAYTPEALESLKGQLKRRTLKRQYRALVEGQVMPREGTWDVPLRERADYHVVVARDGERAVTHYRTLKQTKNRTLLELNLETGRKHQLRVHCAHAGHPIVGDDRYGHKSKGRLCLHAEKLCLVHPRTGKELTLSSGYTICEK